MTTTSDKELLELAAKAAGYEYTSTEDHERLLVRGSDQLRRPWNPLTDDGDALRLAVKLRLTIKHDDPDAGLAGIAIDQSGAPTQDGQGPWFYKEWHKDSDPYAATRRAIVRAAAAIGESM